MKNKADWNVDINYLALKWTLPLKIMIRRLTGLFLTIRKKFSARAEENGSYISTYKQILSQTWWHWGG